MTSGGHARSGPAPDPNSVRSESRGLKFNDLPAEGYQGDIPPFPQPIVFGGEQRYWDWAWRTPQAALWATPQWSWLQLSVADWCSAKAQAENPEAPVAVRSAIKALEAKILLDHQELNRAGYRVVTNEVEAKRAEAAPSGPPSARERAKRLRAVSDDRAS